MKLARAFVLVLSMSPLTLAACSDDGEGSEAGAVPEVDCAATPAPKYSEMATVWAKCTNCHATSLVGAAARSSAPEGYNYDNADVAKATIEEAMFEVAEGSMPLGGSMTEAEKDQLYRWGQCGTPP